MRRTIETGSLIEQEVTPDGWTNFKPRVWRLLDEIYAGTCDGIVKLFIYGLLFHRLVLCRHDLPGDQGEIP